jgi:hypothetical protein
MGNNMKRYLEIYLVGLFLLLHMTTGVSAREHSSVLLCYTLELEKFPCPDRLPKLDQLEFDKFAINQDSIFSPKPRKRSAFIRSDFLGTYLYPASNLPSERWRSILPGIALGFSCYKFLEISATCGVEFFDDQMQIPVSLAFRVSPEFDWFKPYIGIEMGYGFGLFYSMHSIFVNSQVGIGVRVNRFSHFLLSGGLRYIGFRKQLSVNYYNIDTSYRPIYDTSNYLVYGLSYQVRFFEYLAHAKKK